VPLPCAGGGGGGGRAKYSFKFQSKSAATGATQRFARKLPNGRKFYPRRRAPTMAGQVRGGTWGLGLWDG
jgi:hypothetical protein